jgi:hypothetical protein
MNRDALARLLRAGLLTGAADGLFSSVLATVFYNSSVTRLFQGVASAVLGKQALDGGTPTALLGVLIHFGVAFGWSAVFLFVVMRWRRISALLDSKNGVAKVAALYGPFVWLVMSLVVIPILFHRPPSITLRWLVQLIGHIPFVGLPIVATIAKRPPAPTSEPRSP